MIIPVIVKLTQANAIQTGIFGYATYILNNLSSYTTIKFDLQ